MKNSASAETGKVSKVLWNACLGAMTALVRVFQRIGLTPDQVKHLVDYSFVDVLRKDASIGDKPASNSRVAMLMGVRVGNVSKILKQAPPREGFEISSVPSRILSLWRFDEKYLSENRKPRRLDHNEFTELCRRVDGRYASSTVAQELVKSGCMIIHSDKWHEVTDTPYQFNSNEEESLTGMLWRLSAHLGTVAHNMPVLAGEVEEKYWIDRVLHSRHIPDRNLEGIREEATKMLHEFMGQGEEKLGPFEVIGDQETNSIIVGFYYTEVPLSEKTNL